MLAVLWQLWGIGVASKGDTACCLVVLAGARCCLAREAKLNVLVGVHELAIGVSYRPVLEQVLLGMG